jgi:hypothetical protein
MIMKAYSDRISLRMIYCPPLRHVFALCTHKGFLFRTGICSAAKTKLLNDTAAPESEALAFDFLTKNL